MRIIGNDPNTPRQAQIVASGTLPTGDTVVVNANGTVSVVVGGTQELGSPTVYNTSGNTNKNTAVFDTNSNKVVVAYQNNAVGGYGNAVVGTVSGSSISFGTPVVFESANSSEFKAVFDSFNNKVVITYSDLENSSYRTVIVGTVSGTSISFGAASVYQSAITGYTAPVFDSNSNKVVIVYNDTDQDNYGKAIVGTVSGTSISFGTPVLFQSETTLAISATFDTVNNKVIVFYYEAGLAGTFVRGIVGTVSGTSISFGSKATILTGAIGNTVTTFDSANGKSITCFRDPTNSNYGTAIVGAVSGTSISFGSRVVFDSVPVPIQAPAASYDANSGKVIVAYQQENASNFGYLTIGTVSGTSISFASKILFEAATTSSLTSTFDSLNNKVVVAYSDAGNGTRGTAITFNPEFTNLTAENFIGTVAADAASAQRAKINLKGAVDENQSGLTAGQSYYVQTDGTLSTTPDDPSVFAGTAVSATKLIVKG